MAPGNNNGTCPAHEEFRATILTAVGGIRDVLQIELRGLREELSRRLDESSDDRAALHDRVTQVAGHVERLAGRINGEPAPERRRAEDTLGGRIAANWQLLVIAALAALAGDRVIPFVLRLLGLAP